MDGGFLSYFRSSDDIVLYWNPTAEAVDPFAKLNGAEERI